MKEWGKNIYALFSKQDISFLFEGLRMKEILSERN